MANSMDIKLDYSDEKIIPDIDKSLKRIQEIAADTSDLLINEIEVSGVKSALICCEGMLSTSTITNLILLPLTRISLDNPTPEALYEHVFNKLLLSVDRIKQAHIANTKANASNMERTLFIMLNTSCIICKLCYHARR